MFNEKEFLEKYLNHFVIACDEVGRGPIAGPVVAASVGLKISGEISALIDELTRLGINDSKKISDYKRRKILEQLPFNFEKVVNGEVINFEFAGHMFYVCVELLSPAEIDRINILQASLACMKEGSRKIFKSFEASTVILIDGNQTFEKFDSRLTLIPVIKGDAVSKLIGLASVVAKIFRDDLMLRYHEKFPAYGLDRNAGYPTQDHRQAVIKYGPTEIHRKSFKGVREYL
jgi:ribonuclease HII